MKGIWTVNLFCVLGDFEWNKCLVEAIWWVFFFCERANVGIIKSVRSVKSANQRWQGRREGNTEKLYGRSRANNHLASVPSQARRRIRPTTTRQRHRKAGWRNAGGFIWTQTLISCLGTSGPLWTFAFLGKTTSKYTNIYVCCEIWWAPKSKKNIIHVRIKMRSLCRCTLDFILWRYRFFAGVMPMWINVFVPFDNMHEYLLSYQQVLRTEWASLQYTRTDSIAKKAWKIWLLFQNNLKWNMRYRKCIQTEPNPLPKSCTGTFGWRMTGHDGTRFEGKKSNVITKGFLTKCTPTRVT